MRYSLLQTYGGVSINVESQKCLVYFMENPIKNWLVVWLPFFIFPSIGLLIIPIDVHIFQSRSNHQPEKVFTCSSWGPDPARSGSDPAGHQGGCLRHLGICGDGRGSPGVETPERRAPVVMWILTPRLFTIFRGAIQ